MNYAVQDIILNNKVKSSTSILKPSHQNNKQEQYLTFIQNRKNKQTNDNNNNNNNNNKKQNKNKTKQKNEQTNIGMCMVGALTNAGYGITFPLLSEKSTQAPLPLHSHTHELCCDTLVCSRWESSSSDPALCPVVLWFPVTVL